jgi:hypothetical protein
MTRWLGILYRVGLSTALAMYPRVADVVPDFGQRCRHWWPSQVPEPGPLS